MDRVEIDQLGEFLRIHALLFRGRRLPFFRLPDWLCRMLRWGSSIANCDCDRERNGRIFRPEQSPFANKTVSRITCMRALGSSTGIDLKHGVSSVSRNGAACFSLGTKPDHGGRD